MRCKQDVEKNENDYKVLKIYCPIIYQLSHCTGIKTKQQKTSHSSTGGRRICRRGCGTCAAYQLLELGPDSREGNRRSHLPFHFQPALLPLHTFSFFFENFAMASGVKLSDGVKHAYDDIKKHSKYLYAIFIIKVKEANIKVAKKTHSILRTARS